MDNFARLCKDCKHAKPLRFFFIPNWKLAKCDAPQGKVFDPTDGGFKTEYDWCNAQRSVDSDHLNICGKSGKWWEPKK